MGHSTGCQDVVRYVQKYGKTDQPLLGIILQAPVRFRTSAQVSMQFSPAGILELDNL
jgi:predicted alpha/beta hydrolase family esterase